MYTDTSADACGAQLSQEHDDQELPDAFLSHTFTDTQWKWSTTEQEAYDIYYAVTKWNYYLQGSEIVTDVTTTSTMGKVNAPPPLMEDCKDTSWQMQRTDPFCKHVSK